jgi:hypothetical protein
MLFLYEWHQTEGMTSVTALPTGNLNSATLHRNDHLRVTGLFLNHWGELNWHGSSQAKVCHGAGFIVFITMRIA